MATIIVEDGSQVANSNSYATVIEYQAYRADRGMDASANPEQDLIKAMDFLESLAFIGTKKTSTQSLQWPRYYVTIDGWYVENTSIPSILKKAQMAIATAIEQGNDPLGSVERATKREQVGPISVEYMDNASNTTIVKSIPASLWKLVSGGYGYLKVSKG